MYDTVKVKIHLSPQQYAQLEAEAQARGLSPVDLAQAIVEARLRHNVSSAQMREPVHSTRESAVLYDVMDVDELHLPVEDSQTERERVCELLRNAGLITENPSIAYVQPVSDAELAIAAHALAAAGPLSELIIAEREGR